LYQPGECRQFHNSREQYKRDHKKDHPPQENHCLCIAQGIKHHEEDQRNQQDVEKA
jgi:hypothetical protein